MARSRPLLLQYQLRVHPFDACLWTPNGCGSALGLFEGGPTTTFKGKRLADGIESLIGAFYLTGAAAEAAAEAAAAETAAATGTARTAAGERAGDADRTAGGAAGAGGGKTTAAAGLSVSGFGLGDSEIYGVQEPSVPALLDAAAWVWHRVSQPGLEAAAALCEVLEVLPVGGCGVSQGCKGGVNGKAGRGVGPRGGGGEVLEVLTQVSVS